MRKVALVFVLAVFLPSLGLAWLAVLSLRDQQLVLERQQSLLCQSIADGLARSAGGLLEDHPGELARHLDALLARQPAAELAPVFDVRIREIWPLAEVGFAVTLDGRMLSPPLGGRSEGLRFRVENDRFLCNKEIVEIYASNSKGMDAKSQGQAPLKGEVQQLVVADGQADGNQSSSIAPYKGLKSRSVLPQNQALNFQQREPGDDAPTFSKVAASEAEFRQLVGDANEGTLARFLDNKLNVMLWRRTPRDPQIVFGVKLNLQRVVEGLRHLVAITDRALLGEVCVALLDDQTKPAAMSHPGFTSNWRRPMAAAEIGEMLPHWEMAVYLLDPAKLSRTAVLLRTTFSLLIAVLVLAIGVGGWLIVRDLRREMTLARQKTDFVSNVSHELKTPLTSIRMFSELLAEGRVPDVEKQHSYLQIITTETARLTRLINNVLDFSRMERGEKKYTLQRCDLAEVVRGAVEPYRAHLEAAGFKFVCSLPPAPLWVRGDRDALAQVMVNLLSNAEKYAGDLKEIEVEARRQAEPLPFAEIRVLDRGIGVPGGSGDRIFEQFYRAHDSLGSGIQGCGLGLTLARQIARAHGGEVAYEAREGGGSVFTLRLPIPIET
jgi:signal transduction histidine kinase